MLAEENNKMVDINQTDIETLISLPGVGKNTARQIHAGGPYKSIDDLLLIQGIGEKSLNRIRPYITLTETHRDSGVDQEKRRATENTLEPGDQPSVLERLDVFTRNSMGRFQVSNQVVWLVLITGVISVIISVILSLAVLAGINRTLNFGRHSTVREIRSEISQIDTTLDNLAAELAIVDQRLQAVEGLSGRMATLETDFDLINEDVSQTMIVVDQLSEEFNVISEEVEGMTEKVNLFDEFLEALRILISDLFAPVDTMPSSLEEPR